MGIVEDSQSRIRKAALEDNRKLLASHAAWLKFLQKGVEPPDWISQRRTIIALNEKWLAQYQIANDDVNASIAAQTIAKLRNEDDIASGKRGAKAKKDFIKVLLDNSKQHAKDYQEKIRQLEADEKAAAEYKAKREAEQVPPQPSGGSGGGSGSSGSSGGSMNLMATPLGMIPTFRAGNAYNPSLADEEDEEMTDQDVEYQDHERTGEMDFGDGDMERVAYDDNDIDRILVGAKKKRKRRPIPKGKGGMRPATAQDIQAAIARTPEQNRAALAQRIQGATSLTQGYGQQQPGMGYPGGYGGPMGYDDQYMESDPGGYYGSESFPDEGTEGYVVGSAKSGWRKFKNFFKKVFKGAAKSEMAKDALNAYSPGAGDAMQKGMQLIDSAASGNQDALAQVKGIADAAKAGDEAARPAHDLLSTLNDARKEVKAETVTAAVGATMADIQSVLGRYFKITEKKDGKDVSFVLKIVAVHPEAYVQYEVVDMPGAREWKPLKDVYEAMMDKKAIWTDGKGTPIAVGHHHGGFPGMLRMDPRDLYWGPRVDFDDDGQPVFVGHRGHHGGGFRGWGGMAYPPWGGMWYPPMWEEVEFVSDEEAEAAEAPGVKVKTPQKKATAVGHHGGHGMFPGGVMMGPGWGTYEPYPYPGADPWMFEEMEYQYEAAEPEPEAAEKK